jgi:hypothetical protein
LLPVPLSNPDTHTMIGGLHVHTVRPTLSFHEYLNRYSFIGPRPRGNTQQHRHCKR